jgi:RNA polymerase sigma factor (sigma-70 family)
LTEAVGRSSAEWARITEELLALRDPAYWLALRTCGNREVAEEAVQEAYAQVLAKSADARTADDLRPWFLSVVANRTRMILRTEKRRRAREAEVVIETSRKIEASTPVDAETSALMRGALGGLEEKFRLPVHLCLEQGMSRADAAAVLDVPERTLSQRVTDGLDRLRRALEQSGVTMSAVGIGGSLGAAKAITASAPLTAAIRAILSGGTAAKVGTAAGAAAGVAGVSLAWKALTAAGVAALLGLAGFGAFSFGKKDVLPAVAPGGPAPARPSGFEAIMARPETIRLNRESPDYLIRQLARKHGFDWGMSKDLWKGDQSKCTMSHEGSIKTCLQAIAEKTGVTVSFKNQMVRFWRELPAVALKKLRAELNSDDTQRRCVAAWRLGRLGDPRGTALLLKPCLDDKDPAVRYWAKRGLISAWSRHGDERPILAAPDALADPAKWISRALASSDEQIVWLGLAAAGSWRVLGGKEARILDIATGKKTALSYVGQSTACWALGRCGYAPAGDRLLEYLLNSRMKTFLGAGERQAIRTLQRLGRGEDLAKRMMAMLRSDNPEQQIFAVTVLGELKHKPGLPALLKLAADKELSPHIRRAVIIALGRLGDAQALELLEKAAEDKGALVAHSAVSSLANIGGKKALAALERIAEHKGHPGRIAAIGTVVRARGSAVEDWLLDLLKERDANIQAAVLRQLTRVGTKKSLPRIIELADRPTTNRLAHPRTAAIDCLAAIGGPDALKTLVKAVRDKTFFVGMRAARGLGQLGTPRALTELKTLLNEKDGDRGRQSQLASRAMAGFQGMISKPKALEEFVALLRADTTKRLHIKNMYFSAAYSPAAVDRMVALLGDKNERIRRMALASCGNNGRGGPEALPIALKLAGTSADKATRRAALSCLGGVIGMWGIDPRCKPLLLELVAKEKDAIFLGQVCRFLGRCPGDAKVVAALLKKIGPDSKYWTRMSAIRALGDLKASEAVEPLIALLSEKPTRGKSAPMLSYAARALGTLSDKRAVEPLIKTLGRADRSSYYAVTAALGRLGDKRADGVLLTELRKHAKADDKFNLVAAMGALLTIGSPQGVAGVLKCLENPSSQVRFKTAQALTWNRDVMHKKEVVEALAKYRKKYPDDRKKQTRTKPKPRPKPTEPPEVF